MIGPGDFAAAFAVVAELVICALISFAGGYWTLSAWFDRKITGREALLLTGGLLAVQFFAVSLALRGGPGIILLFGVVFGAAVLFRGLAWRAERRLGERLDEEEIAKYQQALELEPDNPYAHSLLADTYRRMGRIELAVTEYEVALRLNPSLREERYWLERLRKELDRRWGKEMSCPRCGEPRPSRASACPECGRLYSSIETWSHALRVMAPSRKAVLLGVGAGALAAALAVTAMAPGKLKLSALLILPLALAAMIAINASVRRTNR